MADPVKGTLEIQSDPGAATRILLDPGKADITAGGNGTAGDLILKGADNSELVRLGQDPRDSRQPVVEQRPARFS